MVKYKCDLFKCPFGKGNLCCFCCDEAMSCEDVCLNNPNKCKLSIQTSNIPEADYKICRKCISKEAK